MSENKRSVKVTFEPEGKTVSDSSRTLLELAQIANTGLRGDCGGVGVCGKCRIQIVKLYGEISAPTEKERDHLKPEEIAAGYRLACQAKMISGKCTVHIPPASRTAKREISAMGLEEDVLLCPAVRKIHIAPKRPSFEDTRPDLERVTDCINSNENIDVNLDVPLPVLSKLPATLRHSGWDVTAALWDDKLLNPKAL